MDQEKGEKGRVDLEHYTDADRADHDRELLEDEGLNPRLREESDETVDGGKVLVLEVPEDEADAAYEILQEYWESEEDETLEIFDDWEEESDETRETFEQM